MRTQLIAGWLALAAVISPAIAADELTLNDLPSVLFKLRGCRDVSGFLSGTTTVCVVQASDMWASVDSSGALTLFRKKSYGDTTYAYGKNVPELLRDFARRLNDESAANKAMLESIAQFLPGQ